MATIKPFFCADQKLGKVLVETSMPSSPKELTDKFHDYLHGGTAHLEAFLEECDHLAVRQMVNERFDILQFHADYSHGTPLAHAVLQDDPALTKLLLKYGADPSMQPCSLRGDRSPSIPIANHMHFALVQFCKPELVSLLLEASSRLITEMQPCFHFCVLDYASKCADANLARRLLHEMRKMKELDLTDHQNMGRTVLQLAISDDNIPVVKILLDMGASVNHQDQQGKTPLMDAAERQDSEMVQMLLRFKADINLADRQGRTALHLAARKLSVALVRLLVQYGSDPSLKSAAGALPIDQALSSSQRRASIAPSLTKNPEQSRAEVLQILLSCPTSSSRLTESQFQIIVFCLLAHGSDSCNDLVIKVLQLNRGHLGVKCPSHPYMPLLHSAVAAGRLSVGKWLIDNGAHIKERDDEGWSAVHYACTASRGDVRGCLQLLLQCGASMNDLTMENWSPIWLLLRHGHVNVARYFIETNRHLNLTHKISVNELRQMNLNMPLPTTLFDPQKQDEQGALQYAKEGKRKISLRRFTRHMGYNDVMELIDDNLTPQ